MFTFFPFPAAVCSFLFLFGFSTNLDAQCPHPDLPALESFYDATNGSAWTDDSGWFSDCEPCGWAGVGCDTDNRVVSLILRGNGLTGTLPAEIAGLDRLELLAIGRNEIGGTIPDALFDMPFLRDINLGQNQFTGTIPATLGNQPDLEYLRLRDNQLTGQIPAGISALTQLRIVMLEDNNLSGAMPEGLGDFPNLITLNLTNNNLEGCFPQDLTALCGQSRVMFSGNNKMTWRGDFSRLCNASFDEPQVGEPCDDDNINTEGDVITESCGCLGGAVNAEGELVGLGEISNFASPDIDATPQVSNLGNISAPVLGNLAIEVADVQVYPNPVVGNEITVTLPTGAGGSSLRLLSLTGRELLRQTSNATSTIVMLPVLDAGMYLVEVVTDGRRSVKRVMVQ